jgi:hypothetical protein
VKKKTSFKTARIRLACGCSINRRDVPVSDGQTFICESGMGHGYRGQAWKTWEFEGRSGSNRKLEGAQENE